MKLATYNLNGIRARLPRLLEWLAREQPDVACLQELKCADESLPIADIEAAGYGNLPICVAKTQYSFSTDPNLRGAPTDHVVPIREIRLSAGAGFVVVICGEIMTMPGLPKVPSAEFIRLDEKGQIDGLF